MEHRMIMTTAYVNMRYVNGYRERTEKSPTLANEIVSYYDDC